MNNRKLRESPKGVHIEAHLVRLGACNEFPGPDVTLPDADWHAAAEIRSLPQRNAFLATRALLRKLLSARIGCPPAAVPIIREANGKLRLLRGGIEFSLSHCEGWCAVALSADFAVGVDVEPIRSMPSMAQVASDFFPPTARAAFDAASPEERVNVFFQWWTRMEAALKASARGLDDSFSCFDGVVHEACDAVPGLALAVAVRSAATPTVGWHLPLMKSSLTQTTTV